jgi:hypothetical protein
MRVISAHDDLDEAIAAVFAAAPDAYELTVVSRGLDYTIARVYLSPRTALVYLAMHGDDQGREPVDVTEMTVPELLNTPAVAADVDNALSAVTSAGQPLYLENWHQNLMAEVSDAQVVHAQVRVATRTGQPPGTEADAAEVESHLQAEIDIARRELTRLAMARAAHIQQLLDARSNRHGAKTEIARLLQISAQSVQDALAANERRWDTARVARPA